MLLIEIELSAFIRLSSAIHIKFWIIIENFYNFYTSILVWWRDYHFETIGFDWYWFKKIVYIQKFIYKSNSTAIAYHEHAVSKNCIHFVRHRQLLVRPGTLTLALRVEIWLWRKSCIVFPHSTIIYETIYISIRSYLSSKHFLNPQKFQPKVTFGYGPPNNNNTFWKVSQVRKLFKLRTFIFPIWLLLEKWKLIGRIKQIKI